MTCKIVALERFVQARFSSFSLKCKNIYEKVLESIQGFQLSVMISCVIPNIDYYCSQRDN